MKKLKIAQLVLPWIALPPKGYGGTERIVSWLTEGLVRRGHEVTLFASGDSQTSAKLSSIVPKALTLQTDVHSTISANLYPLCHVANCFQRAKEFDIIHSHAQYLALPFSAICQTPTVHTFHRKFKGLEDEEFMVKFFKNENFISISDNQREFGLNFVATVYNGIPVEDFEFKGAVGDYLFWAGRAIDKKGPLEAIKVAKATGIPLKMAGIATESDFYYQKIKPQIDGQLISWVGEQDHLGMVNLYQNALATLFPVKWREPFGLIPIESMACGTPVVVYANGAVAEVVRDGATGFVVDAEVALGSIVKSAEVAHENSLVRGPLTSSLIANSENFVGSPRSSGQKFVSSPRLSENWQVKKRGVEGLVEGVKEIKKLRNGEMKKLRKRCRRYVEKNFSVEKMVEGYEKAYEKVLDSSYRI